jgi:hypothetical protein
MTTAKVGLCRPEEDERKRKQYMTMYYVFIYSTKHDKF